MSSQKLENGVYKVYNQVKGIIMSKQNKKTKVRTSPKRKSTAKKRTPRKKVETLQVVDGKEKDIQRIKELEEVLGTAEVNPFGTNSRDILEQNLKEMTLADLQTFAVKVGVLPSGNKTNLKDKIFKAFKETPGAGAGYNVGLSKPIVDPTSEAGKQALKALGDLF